jgi:hypothetical protein
MCSPCVSFPATRAEQILRADSSHGESCEKVTEWTIWKYNVLFVDGRTDNPEFLPSEPNFSSSIFVDQANSTAEIVGNAL